jgi:capsular polysaccharide biosynthesis protein
MRDTEDAMELRRYLQIIRRRWWFVLGAFSFTTAATAWLVMSQPPVYESKGTFVVRPQSQDPEQAVEAVDTLIRGAQINATYAEIARSERIRARAGAQLGESTSTSGLSVTAEALTGTNILSISVRGRDPSLAHEFAAAIGTETMAYVQQLNDTYQLEPLDPASVPRHPVGPSKLLTIALGAIFGMMLGSGLALLGEYLREGRREEHPEQDRSAEGPSEISAEGPSKERLSDERTFPLRLRDEMRRVREAGRSFSFGIITVSARMDAERVAGALELRLRDEDVLASLGNGSYAVLLPDVSADEAEELLIDWERTLTIASLRDAEQDDVASKLPLATAIYEYRDPAFIGDDDDKETERVALMLAEVQPLTVQGTLFGGER